MALLMEACEQATAKPKKVLPRQKPIYTGVNGYRQQKIQRELQNKFQSMIHDTFVSGQGKAAAPK